MPPSISPPRSNDERQRPAERDERAGADRQQQRMPDREPHGDADSARARLTAGASAPAPERQRRNRHQVIGAETVEESEGQCGREQEHNAVYCSFRTQRTSTFRGT